MKVMIFGGSWFRYPRRARVAIRFRSEPDDRNRYLGLRLARTPVQRTNR